MLNKSLLTILSPTASSATKLHWQSSGNNEGLMDVDVAEVREILSRYGRYNLATRQYQRFKADSSYLVAKLLRKIIRQGLPQEKFDGKDNMLG